MRDQIVVTWVQQEGLFERTFPGTDKVIADEFAAALKRDGRAVVTTVRRTEVQH